METLIFFFFLSIAFSFLCSILEAVLLSITPSYQSRAVQEEKPFATNLEQYKKDIDRPLSAILTLNTIAHTVGAIGVGMQAGKLYGTSSLSLGPIVLSYESIIAGLMTLAILILSEIIPKTIGANYWRQLTPFTIRTLAVMLVILAPLVWVSQLITRSLKKKKDQSVLSRADFAAMTQLGAQSGALDDSEYAIIQNLLRFNRLTVRAIMTPQTVSLMAKDQQSIQGFFDQNRPLAYSRIPIFGENRSQITGIVLKDDILRQLADGFGEQPLATLKREANFIQESEKLPILFKQFTEINNHISIVTDEFGSVVGLVTMEDLFETLLGTEIIDESDTVEDLQQMARERRNKKN